MPRLRFSGEPTIVSNIRNWMYKRRVGLAEDRLNPDPMNCSLVTRSDGTLPMFVLNFRAGAGWRTCSDGDDCS